MAFDLNNSKVWFREQFIDYKDAHVSIFNKTFMYGLYVFTGIRANWNAETRELHVFRLDEHYKRFLHSCRIMRFKQFPKLYTRERFIQAVKNTLGENNIYEDIYIRPFSFIDVEAMAPTLDEDAFGIGLYPMGNYVADKGLRCNVSSYTRTEDNAISPHVKVGGAYVNTALTKYEAVRLGYDEAIVLDAHGHAVEGSAENLFIVRDGTLITPPVSANILEGISRKSVIEIAKDEGIPVLERNIDRSELYKADEVFLTGTAARVAIVSSIDDVEVGNGQYNVSERIQSLFKEIAYGFNPKYQDWLTTITPASHQEGSDPLHPLSPN
ncbi:branched-chain amino acid transaminase [Candidatus Uhrbacteria bacterium]|nr:branched-chain amino acid transaminase [Candidatus Uhrbacteria bacterium]MBD3284309.1 branched-chain amino acid transaminase [Candidatus Uhrbacteria bacterium]